MTLLRMSDLASKPGKPGYLPICRAQIYKLINAGEFPAGRLLSPRVRAWSVDEVNRWVDSRSAALNHHIN